jgi:hypothetical protein
MDTSRFPISTETHCGSGSSSGDGVIIFPKLISNFLDQRQTPTPQQFVFRAGDGG